MVKTISIGKIKIGANNPFVFIGGPCVIEKRETVIEIAQKIKKITDELKIPFIFKASYDKANRTSISSFRGLGIEEGLKILSEVKKTFDLPILTDVHSVGEVEKAAHVVDIIQIPAFLCRQTDLLIAAAKSKRIVNIKKGQFLAPWDMNEAVKKVEESGNDRILLTDRGTSFGYNNLVSDFRSLAIMRETGYPVIFDASHSVQQPGGLGKASGGKSEFIPLLARCGVAAGSDGIFMEVHTAPEKALSDGPNMLALSELENVLKTLKEIDEIVKNAQRK